MKRLEQFRETPWSGHSANSPTFSSAAAYTAAYTFSAASLHTPQRSRPGNRRESRSETPTDLRAGIILPRGRAKKLGRL